MDWERLSHADSSVGFLLALDVEGRILAVSEGFVDLLSRTREEVLGRTIEDCFGREIYLACFEPYLGAALEGTFQVSSTPFNLSGEVPRYLTPIFIPDLFHSRDRSLVILLKDETGVRTALAGAQERYRSLIEQTPDAVFFSGPDGELIYANARSQELFGYSEDEFHRLTEKDLTADQIDPSLFPPSRHARGDERIAELCGKDGARILARISRKQVLLGGKPFSQVMVRDITQQYMTTQALKEHQARSLAMEEQSPFITFTFQKDGRLYSWNQAAEKQFGWQRSEILGRNFKAIFALPTASEESRKILEKVFTGQSVDPFEVSAKDRGGDLFPFRGAAFPIRDADGDIVAGAVIGQDITLQRMLEVQLAQSQKMETIGTLAGGIAHDYNNQLTAIIGNLSMIIDDMSEKDPLRRQLTDALNASRRCSEMTRNLLTFSRQISIQKKTVDLRDLVDEVHRLIGRVLPSSIEISVQHASRKLMIHVDPTQIQQVILNLSVNARDAMESGGELSIATGIRRTVDKSPTSEKGTDLKDFVFLTLSDTGSGMPPEVLSRIFEPFFTTKEIGKGTGLGLSMVYGIMQSHEGWIEVQSVEREGTTFTLFFPIADREAEIRHNGIHLVTEGNESILFVDDEPDVCRIGERSLLRRGYTVFTAHDGEEALEVFERHQSEITLAVLDIIMPKMDGRTLMRELLRRKPELKVLLSSGFTGVARYDPESPMEEAVVLPKPYSPDELAVRIRDLLDHGN